MQKVVAASECDKTSRSSVGDVLQSIENKDLCSSTTTLAGNTVTVVRLLDLYASCDHAGRYSQHLRFMIDIYPSHWLHPFCANKLCLCLTFSLT
jgi:hypothetical protein